MAVDCGHICCANQSGGVASNSSNGWRNETYNLAAECWSHVVGLHVDTHLSAISSAGNFLCKLIFFLPGRSVSISNRLKYFNAVVSSAACLRNGHRAGNLQLPAATLDSTNSNIMQSNCWIAIKGWLKCCLMLLGTRFLIYGRNGAGILDLWPGITCTNKWNWHRWVQRLLCKHAVCTRGHTWEPQSMHTASMRILDIGKMQLSTTSYGTYF